MQCPFMMYRWIFLTLPFIQITLTKLTTQLTVCLSVCVLSLSLTVSAIQITFTLNPFNLYLSLRWPHTQVSSFHPLFPSMSLFVLSVFVCPKCVVLYVLIVNNIQCSCDVTFLYKHNHSTFSKLFLSTISFNHSIIFNNVL